MPVSDDIFNTYCYGRAWRPKSAGVRFGTSGRYQRALDVHLHTYRHSAQCYVHFKGINILEDESLRQGIKNFSDWPTIPQLYVKGEFIGGCDIVKEMFEKGELKELLKSKQILK